MRFFFWFISLSAVLRLNAMKKPINVEMSEMKNSKVLPLLVLNVLVNFELMRNKTTTTKPMTTILYINIIFLFANVNGQIITFQQNR